MSSGNPNQRPRRPTVNWADDEAALFEADEAEMEEASLLSAFSLRPPTAVDTLQGTESTPIGGGLGDSSGSGHQQDDADRSTDRIQKDETEGTAEDDDENNCEELDELRDADRNCGDGPTAMVAADAECFGRALLVSQALFHSAGANFADEDVAHAESVSGSTSSTLRRAVSVRLPLRNNDTPTHTEALPLLAAAQTSGGTQQRTPAVARGAEAFLQHMLTRSASRRRPPRSEAAALASPQPEMRRQSTTITTSEHNESTKGVAGLPPPTQVLTIPPAAARCLATSAPHIFSAASSSGSSANRASPSLGGRKTISLRSPPAAMTLQDDALAPPMPIGTGSRTTVDVGLAGMATQKKKQSPSISSSTVNLPTAAGSALGPTAIAAPPLPPPSASIQDHRLYNSNAAPPALLNDTLPPQEPPHTAAVPDGAIDKQLFSALGAALPIGPIHNDADPLRHLVIRMTDDSPAESQTAPFALFNARRALGTPSTSSAADSLEEGREEARLASLLLRPKEAVDNNGAAKKGPEEPKDTCDNAKGATALRGATVEGGVVVVSEEGDARNSCVRSIAEVNALVPQSRPAARSPPPLCPAKALAEALKAIEDLFYISDADPRLPLWCPWRTMRDTPRGLRGWGLPDALCGAYTAGGGSEKIDAASADDSRVGVEGEGLADDEAIFEGGAEVEEEGPSDGEGLTSDVPLYPWQRACLYEYFSNLQRREEAAYGIPPPFHPHSQDRRGRSVVITSLLDDLAAIAEGCSTADATRKTPRTPSPRKAPPTPQQHQQGAATTSCNMLYSAPTGGGKTLVAEVVMLRCCIGIARDTARGMLASPPLSSAGRQDNRAPMPILFAADLAAWCLATTEAWLAAATGGQNKPSEVRGNGPFSSKEAAEGKLTKLVSILRRHARALTRPLPPVTAPEAAGGADPSAPPPAKKVMFIVPYVALAEEKAEAFTKLIDAYNSSLGSRGRDHAEAHAAEGAMVTDRLCDAFGAGASVTLGGEISESDDDAGVGSENDDDGGEGDSGAVEADGGAIGVWRGNIRAADPDDSEVQSTAAERRGEAAIVAMLSREAWLACRVGELERSLRSSLAPSVSPSPSAGHNREEEFGSSDSDGEGASGGDASDQQPVAGLVDDTNSSACASNLHRQGLGVATCRALCGQRTAAAEQRHAFLSRLQAMHMGQGNPADSSASYGKRRHDKTHGTTGPSAAMGSLLASMALAKRVQCHAGQKGHRSLSHDVLVCTIEKANVLLNIMVERGRAAELSCVIVDEVHQIREHGRGYVLELLLTKLVALSSSTLTPLPTQQQLTAAGSSPSVSASAAARGGEGGSARKRPRAGTTSPSAAGHSLTSNSASAAAKDLVVPPSATLKVIGMSATLSNAPTLCQWMKEAVLFVTDFRPVPLLEHYVVQGAVFAEASRVPPTPPSAPAAAISAAGGAPKGLGTAASPYAFVRNLPQSLAHALIEEKKGPPAFASAWAQQTALMERDLQTLAAEGAVGGHQVLVFCPSRAMCESGAELITLGLGRLME